MPVSPLTPLSLATEINLNRLRSALRQLEEFDNYHIDTGGWCCKSCALSDAWSEGNGKAFVYWHEESEEHLHKNPAEPMPIYFGIAREEATEAEICNVAKRTIEVLGKNDLNCKWEQGNVTSPILVQLNKHIPYPGDPFDEDEEPDSLEVAFYLQKNKETEEYCWNESEDDGEPEGAFYFYQKINDGESVQDAYLEIDPVIRKYITHYERCATINSSIVIWDAVFSIDHAHGHRGSGDTLLDGIRASEDEVDQSENRITYVEDTNPYIMTFDLSGFKELLEKGRSRDCQYIFLIKRIGICLYIRSTDYEDRDDTDFMEMTLAANGIDEDGLDIESKDYDKERSALCAKANPLYPGDLCEWLALDPEMIDDCDVMLDKGYDQLRIVVDSISLDLSRFGEQEQNNLRAGGLLIHNRSIRLGGGPCPLSQLDVKMRFDYMKSNEGSNSAVPCLPSSKARIHLDRTVLQQ